ncbi:MAG TPA: hypothetical protein VML53_05045 [Thermoplasmata archaeon]|nr:hypothetical protein [Thermoplasmata archaeon]
MKIACDDGFELVTKDQKELVSMTRMHLENTHHRSVSDPEILAMAKHP